jgi:hypothetical protein
MVKVALDPLVNVPMVHAPVLLIVPAPLRVAYIGIACWQYIIPDTVVAVLRYLC